MGNNKNKIQSAFQTNVLNLGGRGHNFTNQSNIGNYIKTLNKKYETVDINTLVPAPKEWNFFPEYSEAEMLEMIYSLIEVGMIYPIIVWHHNDEYMILAGHNRVRACKRIIEENSDNPNVDISKYKNIQAIIYNDDEMTETKAKMIITDTNYIQRSPAAQSKLMTETIRRRIDYMKEARNYNGQTIGEVAEEMNLKKSRIYEIYRFTTRLVDDLQELYFSGTLSLKDCLRFSIFTKEVQQEIYDKYKDKITTNKVRKITKSISEMSQIDEIMNEDIDIKKNCSFLVKEELVEEFKKMCEEWLKEHNA